MLKLHAFLSGLVGFLSACCPSWDPDDSDAVPMDLRPIGFGSHASRMPHSQLNGAQHPRQSSIANTGACRTSLGAAFSRIIPQDKALMMTDAAAVPGTSGEI